MSGRAWSREMKCDYGYIPGTSAAGDEESVDVYVGPDENSEFVYVVEQVGPTGEFDEYKLMLGFPNLEAAEEMFEQQGPEEWDGLGDISEIPLEHLFDAVEEHRKTAADPDLIEKFVVQYERQRGVYGKAADVVRKEIADACEKKGIRCAVVSRAKEVDSLRKKLEKRNALRPYVDFKDIRTDIKDLAGVRVALYFPIDRDGVRDIIKKLYKMARPVKHFPEDRGPEDGEDYEADHYAIKYAGLIVEIQVASALMLAWSEVAHDLVYKPRMGEVTPAEYQLLDELKDIVKAGEHTVTQLQDSVMSRIASIPSEAQRVAARLYATTILTRRNEILAGGV